MSSRNWRGGLREGKRLKSAGEKSERRIVTFKSHTALRLSSIKNATKKKKERRGTSNPLKSNNSRAPLKRRQRQKRKGKKARRQRYLRPVKGSEFPIGMQKNKWQQRGRRFTKKEGRGKEIKEKEKPGLNPRSIKRNSSEEEPRVVSAQAKR